MLNNQSNSNFSQPAARVIGKFPTSAAAVADRQWAGGDADQVACRLDDVEHLHRLGVAFRQAEDFAVAEMYYDRALSLSCEIYGADSLETARHRNFLAGAYFAAGHFQQCMSHLKAVLETYRVAFGSDHFYTQLTQFALALSAVGLGDEERAARYYAAVTLKQMLSIADFDCGSGLSTLLMKVAAIACIKFEQEAFQDSIELFRFCIVQETDEAWPGSEGLAKVLHELSVLCRSQGLRRDAAEFAQMSENIRRTNAVKA